MIADELSELCTKVDSLNEQYHDALEQRNSLMSELRALGLSIATLMRLTGLSRDSVARITQGSYKSFTQESTIRSR